LDWKTNERLRSQLQQKDKAIERLQFELVKTRLNEREKEYRIYKAISYINNTYEINDLK